jgi:DNA ligase-1
LQSIYDIIQSLKNTSSINEKIEILKQNKNNDLLKKIFWMTYDNLIVYGVNQKTIPVVNPKIKEISKEEFNKILNEIYEFLHIKKLRGHKAIEFLQLKLESLDNNNQEILKNILLRDMKCGVNKKLLQKIWPDMFFEIGYMGAVKYDKKKIIKVINEDTFVFAQEKMDGEYVNLVIDIKNNDFKAYARSNKPVYFPENIINLFNLDKIKKYDKIILNGELLIKGYPRYTSNGLITRIRTYFDYVEKNDFKKAEKALKMIEEISQDTFQNIINKIYYVIWDVRIPEESQMLYFERIEFIFKNKLLNEKILFVPMKIFKLKEKKLTEKHKEFFDKYIQTKIFNYEELNTDKEIFESIMKFFTELLMQGAEGVIVKGSDRIWENKKPNYQIKLKLEFDCELRIKNFNPGKKDTKYENALGAFVCESEDGLLKCSVSGIPEDLRFEIWENREKYKDKIITVKCCGISQDKDGNKSLLHPSFEKIRYDKDKADTLNDIEEIQESILNLKS